MARTRRAPSRGPDPRGRAAETAAGYEAVIQKFLSWAEGRPDIRAAAIVGSRARTDHPADEWADLDLGLFVTDPGRYRDDETWVEELGHPWITFIEPTAVGDSFERRVLFDPGLDVDVALFPASLLTGMASGTIPADFANTIRRGIRILVDRDGTFALVAAHLPETVRPVPPTKKDVLEAIGDFWYHAVWTAKHLRRGELWWAKGSCDRHMKDLLQHMLEWHTRLVRSPEQDTWMRGRFLEEWADPRARRALKKTFAHYDEDDVWRALLATMDLYRWLAREVADKLGCEYPVEGDRHATELVRTLAAGRRSRRRGSASGRAH